MSNPIVRETHAKTVLVRSRIPGVSYAVNPYGGCSHGCVYCYAVFMRRYQGRSEDWGGYVDVKVNSPEVLERDVRLMKGKARERVLLSSVCDPYLPEEKRYRLTRRVLAILLNSGFPVSILTKSDLVTRDLDIIKRFRDIDVGLTVTGLGEKDRVRWEPRASSHKERIEALGVLRDAGVITWAFIGPVLPGITDIERIFRDISGKVEYAMVDRLNLRPGTWERLEPFLARYYPSLLRTYRGLHRGDEEFWRNVMIKAGELARKHGVKARIIR